MLRQEFEPQTRYDEEIEIAYADTWIDGLALRIGTKASVGIIDPRIKGTKNSFCIGYEYKGGPVGHPKSWVPSGTHYWPDDNFSHPNDTVPMNVSNEVVNAILRPRGTSVQQIFTGFLKSMY